MYSDTQPQAQCVYHPGNLVTNFCRLQTCFMPLCPKCIPSHLDKHKQNGEHAELETVDQMHSETLQLIQSQLTNLNQALVKLHKFKDSKSDAHGSLHDTLNMARNKVLRQVEAFFDQMLQDLDHVTHEDKTTLDSEIQVTENSILNKLQELQGVEEKMKTPKYLKNIIQILGTNYLQQLQQHSYECEAFIEEVQKKTLDIQLDESKLYNLNVELSKFISIKNAEYYITDQKPKATQHPYLYKSDINSRVNNNSSRFQQSLPTQPIQKTEINFQISANDYFEQNVAMKYLHYFSDTSLWIYNLEADIKRQKWTEIQLIQQVLPRSTKIVSPQGDLYVIGGVYDNQTLNIVSRFDFRTKQFVQADQMGQHRHSASAVFLNSKLYVLGGQSQNDDLNTIEQVELLGHKSKTYNQNKLILPKMQQGGANLSVCGFRHFIVKVSPLEIFDSKASIWIIVNFNIPKSVGLVQINQTQVLVFGQQYGIIRQQDLNKTQFYWEQLQNDNRLQNIQNGALVHGQKVYAVTSSRQVAIFVFNIYNIFYSFYKNK
ncbi:hypothetical protein pb186bvf_006496 [Paramecium bursaria]